MSETKNEIIIVDEQSLRNKAYIIRGQQVMLDYDLAEIYGFTVSAFNQQVKRNAQRFPGDFLFELSHEEYDPHTSWQSAADTEMMCCHGVGSVIYL